MSCAQTQTTHVGVSCRCLWVVCGLFVGCLRGHTAHTTHVPQLSRTFATEGRLPLALFACVKVKTVARKPANPPSRNNTASFDEDREQIKNTFGHIRPLSPSAEKEEGEEEGEGHTPPKNERERGGGG